MFGIIAEMKEPRDFKRSLAFAQITLTVTYLVSLFSCPPTPCPPTSCPSIMEEGEQEGDGNGERGILMIGCRCGGLPILWEFCL
jgi:hypothetical protein